MLTELLKEIIVEDHAIGLTGTGFDEAQLASLLMITRPASEIKDKDEAAEWLGMPDWEGSSKRLTVIVSFDKEEDKQEFARILGYTFTPTTKSIWFPHKPKDDTSSIEFQ
jgi:hypothetical protein